MKTKTSSTGAALRRVREFAGLTLEQVASEAKTTASYLSNVETGRATASYEYIARITEAVGMVMRQNAALAAAPDEVAQ